MLRAALLSVMVLLSACAPVVSNRPCPAVTEFPAELQRRVVPLVETYPDLRQMMDAMAADRAFNRAICR